WSAIARTVREVDGEIIRGHKEDVDTLLVFAGLFSAVMTSFLIESYRNLQEDPAEVTVRLLTYISLQLANATTTSGPFTTDPTLLFQQPFIPSSSAGRVNVLWFASLNLSLMTASLSILAKQWLREFLAGEHTSPQAHLRIHYFRYPGLAKW
ncbi:hypothetical protein K474DRAFT_1571015, partial [Panus rudis PR-1116 ss-1]